MHTELANLWLFARAIAKLSITTGFGFGLAGMAIVHIGRTYRITGVFVGEFMGRCIGIVTVGGQRFIQIVITDTMRPSPKVFDKCFYPQCIRKVDHGGDHEFPRIRTGNYIDVPADARFVEVERQS
jgi:hypothetical protein